MTRIVLCIVWSTAAPQMIRAVGLIVFWTTSAAFWASLTVISGPPVTLMRAPVAPAMSTCRSGELIASRTASSARLSLSDSPMPMSATPPPFMIVLRSLKSRFTRPGARDDLGDPADRAREDGVGDLEGGLDRQARNELEEAVVRDRDDGVHDLAQPLEAPHRVLLADKPFGGERERADGDRERVPAPGVLRALSDHGGRAGTRPASEPERDEDHVGVPERLLELVLRLLRRLFADLGKRPAPRPRVSRRPRRIFRGEWIASRCWASVLAATISAPASPSSASRLMVLHPPPPQPMTLMFVLSEARTASSSASSFDGGGASGALFESPGRWARISWASGRITTVPLSVGAGASL